MIHSHLPAEMEYADDCDFITEIKKEGRCAVAKMQSRSYKIQPESQ